MRCIYSKRNKTCVLNLTIYIYINIYILIYIYIVRVAQNRDAWKGVVQLVVAKYKSNQEAKVLLKTELRHATKTRSAEDIST